MNCRGVGEASFRLVFAPAKSFRVRERMPEPRPAWHPTLSPSYCTCTEKRSCINVSGKFLRLFEEKSEFLQENSETLKKTQENQLRAVFSSAMVGAIVSLCYRAVAPVALPAPRHPTMRLARPAKNRPRLPNISLLSRSEGIKPLVVAQDLVYFT